MALPGLSSPYNRRLRAPQGKVWTARSSGFAETLNSIAFADGQFVIVGNAGRVAASPTGVYDWVAGTGLSGTVDYRAVAYDPVLDMWVTGGGTGSSGSINSSPDGLTWTARTNPASSFLMGVASNGAGRFAGVWFNGLRATSDNGTSWTTRGTHSAALYEVTFGNSLFVAVGASGDIITSPDGITWTSRTSNTSATLRAVRHGGGQFIAAGHTGVITRSPDGITWTASTIEADVYWMGIAYALGTWVICGYEDTTVNEKIYTSQDGITWTEYSPVGTGSQLFEIAYGAGKFVIVSTNGLTYTAT